MSKSPSRPADSRPGKEPGSTLRKAIRDFFVEGFTDGLDRMFSDADDVLFDMANRASSNKEQQNMMDTLRVVRLRREAIKEKYLADLAARFEPDFDPVAPEWMEESVSIRFEDLKLQDSDDQEKDLATKNMVRRAEGLCQMQIWELQRRLNYIERETDLDLSFQALEPAAICNVFRTSMEALDVEVRTILIIYKLFEKVLVNGLPTFYKSLNEFLAGEGVEELDASQVVRTPDAPPPPDDAHEIEDEEEDWQSQEPSTARLPPRGQGGPATRGGPTIRPGPGQQRAAARGGAAGRPGKAGHGSRAPQHPGRGMGRADAGQPAHQTASYDDEYGDYAGQPEADEYYSGNAGQDAGGGHHGAAVSSGGHFNRSAEGSPQPAAQGGQHRGPTSPGQPFWSRPVDMDPATVNYLESLPAQSAMGASHGPGHRGAEGGAHDSQASADPQGYGSGGGGGNYHDNDLARDLVTASRGGAVKGWPQQRQYSYLRRADAVGRMFNSIIEDPNVPQRLKPQFEELRFNAIKASLHDADFFRNKKHPVRNLINELADMAASAQVTRGGALERLESLITDLRQEFEQPAEPYQPDSPWEAEPEAELADDDFDHFLDDQLERMKKRRESIIRKARQVASEEFSLRRLGHELRDEIIKLLQQSWVPMMALHLLNHGGESERWKAGLELIDPLILALDPSTPSELTTEQDHDLVKKLANGLADVGMDPAKIEQARQQLTQELDRIREIAETMAEYSDFSRLEEPDTETSTEAQVEPEPDEVAAQPQVAVKPATEDAPAQAESEFSFDLPEQDQPTRGEDELNIDIMLDELDADEAANLDADASESTDELPSSKELDEFALTEELRALDRQLGEADEKPAAAAGSSPEVTEDVLMLLDGLITPGTWFQVFDHESGQSKWMRAIAHYSGKRNIGFSDFNYKNSLVVDDAVFIRDLARGLTTPIDPTPMMRETIRALTEVAGEVPPDDPDNPAQAAA